MFPMIPDLCYLFSPSIMVFFVILKPGCCFWCQSCILWLRSCIPMYYQNRSLILHHNFRHFKYILLYLCLHFIYFQDASHLLVTLRSGQIPSDYTIKDHGHSLRHDNLHNVYKVFLKFSEIFRTLSRNFQLVFFKTAFYMSKGKVCDKKIIGERF